MRYFAYATGLRMTSERFHALFGGPPRGPDDPVDQRTMDLAASIQQVTDDIVLRLARSLRRETGERNLCLAGGVALNCVSNGLLAREGVFDELWIQPAAGDAGGALGAALLAWHHAGGERRPATGERSHVRGLPRPRVAGRRDRALLPRAGPALRAPRAGRAGRAGGGAAGRAAPWSAGCRDGWSSARARSATARSSADPRDPAMQRTLNLKIKFRESFRPFAPAVLRERVAEHFELDQPSPYMLLVAPVRDWQPMPSDGAADLRGLERLRGVRSPLPAVTHVDGSARVQTVDRSTNPIFHDLIAAFGDKTGVPVLVNTSFNVRGEPIVCSPTDAYRCFMATAIDLLVMGPCVLERAAQPADHPLLAGRREFEPD